MHTQAVLGRVVADLQAQSPDHIAVTGDLVNIGLPAEYLAAARWLRSLGAPDHVSVIPGNHDVYVHMAADAGIGHWQAYMTGTVAGEPQGFPFVRRLRHVALIGLNSAVPTPPFHASGRLGRAQLARFGQVLHELGRERLVRVVLVHHPALPGLAPPRCALQDAEGMAAVLAQHGAELVLHGHNHRLMINHTPGPGRPIPVVGAASASAAEHAGHRSLARYHVYNICSDPGAPIEMVERGLSDAAGTAREISRRSLSPEHVPG